MNRFLQIHTLTSYPASLLNRDDAGFAKRIPFGGATRTRISSQCLKRHWRTFDGEGSLSSLGVPMSVRSRFTFEELVVKPLVQKGIKEELARNVTQALMDEVLGKSAKAAAKKEGSPQRQGEGARTAKAAVKRAAKEAESKKKDNEGNGNAESSEEAALQTGQITVLGRPEVQYLFDLAREVCGSTSDPANAKDAVADRLGREGKKNLAALRIASGLDAALFGRMVTSDILARGDAAVHVAHAFTVHAEASESDYFSAVDDLLSMREEEALGAGHIGTSELTSGLFYGYVVVDVPLLVSNLEGVDRKAWTSASRELASAVVEKFVRLVATVSPGAKLGSTAPHAYAHLVMLEAGNAQPRTLANAFLKPADEHPDLVENAYRALGRHAAELDHMYGPAFARRLAAIGPVEGLRDTLKVEKVEAIAEVASWAASQVRGA